MMKMKKNQNFFIPTRTLYVHNNWQK